LRQLCIVSEVELHQRSSLRHVGVGLRRAEMPEAGAFCKAASKLRGSTAPICWHGGAATRSAPASSGRRHPTGRRRDGAIDADAPNSPRQSVWIPRSTSGIGPPALARSRSGIERALAVDFQDSSYSPSPEAKASAMIEIQISGAHQGG